MTKSNNLYLLLIIQAILTIILFFAESYLMYATMLVFFILDIVILIVLIMRKWGSGELFTFTTLIYSILFLIFILFMSGPISIVIGIGLMLLFLLSALLVYNPRPKAPRKLPELSRPTNPLETYHADEERYDMDKFEKELDEELQAIKRQKPVESRLSEQARSIIKQKESKTVSEDSKQKARALAYELEREAAELKRAESYVRKKETDMAEDELEKEAAELNRAESYVRKKQKAAAKDELEQESAELGKVQKFLDEQTLNKKEDTLVRQAVELKKADNYLRNKDRQLKKKELEIEAKNLEGAQKQLEQVQFLDKQEQIIKQAKALAKVQKKVDQLTKKSPKTIVKTKTVKEMDKSMFVVTEKGNRFHEPGCLSLKKTPKNKLILFTSKKDALKKGYQPCDVCKP